MVGLVCVTIIGGKLLLERSSIVLGNIFSVGKFGSPNSVLYAARSFDIMLNKNGDAVTVSDPIIPATIKCRKLTAKLLFWCDMGGTISIANDDDPNDIN